MAARLADFEDGGGGVASIFRNPSSKLTPGNFRFNDLPINFRFTWLEFSTFLAVSKAQSQMARPRKIQWPIGFEDLLRYMFPQKRREDRFKFYRLFLRDYIDPHTTARAAEKEIEERFKSDRNRKFTENEAFHWRMWSAGSANLVLSSATPH